MENLVLIGMLGSGVKELAAMCSEKLGFKYVDTDEVLTRNIGLSLQEMYSLMPPDNFEELTQRLCSQLADGSGYAIAAGDSVLKSSVSTETLKRSDIIIRIDTPIDDIFASNREADHPLLARGRQRLYPLFDERRGILSALDIPAVEFSGDWDYTVSQIIDIYRRLSSSGRPDRRGEILADIKKLYREYLTIGGCYGINPAEKHSESILDKYAEKLLDFCETLSAAYLYEKEKENKSEH